MSSYCTFEFLYYMDNLFEFDMMFLSDHFPKCKKLKQHFIQALLPNWFPHANMFEWYLIPNICDALLTP